MAFSRGDTVVVLALGRRGVVVEAHGGSWRIAVGGLTISCREDELAPAVDRGRTRRARAAAETPAHAGPADRPAHVSSSIDLHGLTVAEARDALLRHLDRALLDGDAVVEVVHGIGTGKVRAAVLKELKGISAVRHVRPHPTNRGATLVYL